MPNIIRMFRASDDALLATENVPSEGTHDPADIFDLTALDGVDVYFEMATEPTDEYTTPAFTTPAITSAHIAATDGGTVITEADVGDVLWAVANSVTGYPTPTLGYQWKVNGTPPGGTDDEESFDTTGLDDEDEVTVDITPTNAAGSGTPATSAGVEVSASAEAALISILADMHANGVPATLYNVSDISTLWQDLARTIPVTAHGQPVAVMDDKISGNHPMLIENEVERPLYQTDGVRHWLVFDGINNAMQTAGTFDVVNEVTLGIAGRFLDNSGSPVRNLTHLGLSQADSGSTNYVRLGSGTTNNPIRHEIYSRYGAGNIRSSEYVTIAALNDDYASIGWGDGDTLHVVCGTESSSNTTEPDTAPDGQQPLRLGNSSGRRVYGAAFAHDTLPPADRDVLKAFLEGLYA